MECARRYRARGFVITPIHRGEKAPFLPGWKTKILTEEEVEQYFGRDECNIGVLNGEINRHLVDIDVDAPEAVFAARTFLPHTACVFGRASKPASHWLYTAPGLDTTKFEDFAGDKRTLIEIRSDDSQTVWPGSTHPSGETIEFDHFDEPARIDGPELKAAVGRVAACALIARHWPGIGARHQAALAYAGFLGRNGCDEDVAEALIVTAAECAADLEGPDRKRAVTDTYAKLAAGENVTGLPTLAATLDRETADRIGDRLRKWLGLTAPGVTGIDEVGADGERLTDVGNARRLAAHHGTRLRYVHTQKTWYVYDGKRWAADDTGEVVRLAHKTLHTLLGYAAALSDKAQRHSLVQHAIVSESDHRVRAMVSQARALLPARAAGFDADPFLLNVENGTLDLRTGALRPHRMEDHLTKLAPVEYDATAAHPVWDRFLADATGGDEQLAAFLQRAVGYSLTGDTREEKLFFVHGPAASGKSTFIEAVKGILGDYAKTANFNAFLERFGEGTREDLARLAGARLVASSEVKDGKTLAEEVIKSFTGGDVVAARHLYQATFEYRPQFKLWLVANHKPRVNADDAAMWRRILLLPFERVVPEGARDPHVKTSLTDPNEAGRAILAWAVRGCLAWQAEGLRVPLAVKQATAAYQDEMDVVARFVCECCETRPDFEVSAAALSAAARVFFHEQGLRHPPAASVLGRRLAAMGFKGVRTKSTRKWIGLRIIEDAQTEVAA